MALYHLGLPAWAYAGWNNVYFNARPSALASYASVFNTVEGNTTFYHIPDKSSVMKWRSSVEDTDFKFCFKFPRTVTHERTPNMRDLDLFITRITPLANYWGPFLLQFPSTTGPEDTGKIESILSRLPQQVRCAIEVRHEGFFSQPERLEPLIEKYKLGRVIMDTRAVFKGNRNHPEVMEALHKKPDLPVMGQVYNRLMMVRLLLHPDLTSNERYIDQWVARTAHALSSGCECYVMIHCPNNQHCPPLSLLFHQKLQHLLDTAVKDYSLRPLAPWPIPQQATLL